MEQNKNKRLDDLFNQVKNEPSKTSFEDTKAQFLNSNVGIGNMTKGGKLTHIINSKIIIMITTICAVAVGTIMFYNNASEPIIEENKIVETTKISITDSALIVKEHEKVITEYFEKVAALSPQLLENDTNKIKIKKRKSKIIDKTWFLTENDVLDESIPETVETYRFPNLNDDEWKVHLKRMKKMFGKVKKQKKSRGKKLVGVQGREQWYQPDPKGFLFIPMGTYNRKDENISVQAFYMKQTAVTNLEYRTFLFELLRQDRKEEFLKAKPDQTRWVKDYPNAFNGPMQENYFSHPAYDDYPVVAISRKGAEMYCEWMTEELNRVSGGLVNDFRLPTNYEWEWAARGGLENVPYPWGGPYLRNSNGCFLANFKPGKSVGLMDCTQNFKEAYTEIKGIHDSVKTKDDVIISKKYKNPYSADGGYHAVKVNSYNPNDFGLYCMSGNVSEMIFDENNKPATKGGSWSSIGQELQIVEGVDRFKGLTKASVDVGFRPVMTYLAKEKNLIGGSMGDKTITVTPFGTVKINNNLFFDKTEVSNFAWKTYLGWLENKHGKLSSEYLNARTDTTVWNNLYKELYLKHSAYEDYPVVGISYDQAIAFCKWRTERLKEYFDAQKVKNDKEIYPKDFEYRLPTKSEWEKVARVGYSLKTLKRLEKKYKGQKRNNLKREGNNMGVPGKLNDNEDITA
ncbi:MAG: SUMF1/EgtB/PvdO family nonheme iron enzyme, partial [Flavobacteriales bacterium]|nr:SUMF1/EgtB/PvdO family nonheme iron enzyme [Flavobacteriales bacterium]